MPSDPPVKSDCHISPDFRAGLVRLVLLLIVIAPLHQARALNLFPHRDQPKPAITPAEKTSPANRARRLQQEVMDFSDRFVMGIWQALDEYLRSESDPRKRLAAETLKTSLASSSMEIAAGSDPAADLLDMYVFTKLSGAAIRHYWVPEVFGSKAEGLKSESARLQRELDGILSDLLPSMQLGDMDDAIKTWQRTHPEMIYITDTNGAKLRHFWDGFGVGFFTCSGSGFEKDFLANGTHFFEDGFELLIGSDSLFQKVGLFLRERQGDGFCFDLCCPLPVARVIGCHTSMGYPLQRG
jgi:hypothetical protein